MAKEKTEKPKVTVEIVCPECHRELVVEVYKRRTNPAPKAEYEVTAKVRVDDQKRLFMDRQEDNVTARKPDKPKKRNRRRGMIRT